MCSPTESIAPGNASTTSAMKRWPLAISTRTCAVAHGGAGAEALRGCRAASASASAGFEHHHVAADAGPQLRGAALGHDLALVQQHQAVAAVGLVQDVGGEQNGNAFVRRAASPRGARVRAAPPGRGRWRLRPSAAPAGGAAAPWRFRRAGAGRRRACPPGRRGGRRGPAAPWRSSMRSRNVAPLSPCRWPCARRFSSTVSALSRLWVWKTTPTVRRTSAGSRATSKPATAARAFGGRHHGGENAEQRGLAAAVRARAGRRFRPSSLRS